MMTRPVAVVACSAFAIALAVGGEPTKDAKTDGATAKSVFDFTVQDIDGKDVKLSKYAGDVCLIVNLASL
jgi:cytochrome oxidase Cu insertion factor (SCO1/SenC/PrrC family)